MNISTDRLVSGATVVAVCGTILLLVMPTGLIGSQVRAWRAQHDIELAIGRNWSMMDSLAQRIGSGSKVAMFEFADYECPYCRMNHAALSSWLEQHPNVSLGYIHLPLNIHPNAAGAARASLCADAAGRGSEMHDLLMSSEEWRTDTAWNSLAAQAGVIDTVAFAACRTSDAISARLARSAIMAANLGVTGTPTFVFSDSLVVGAVGLKMLERLP